MKPTELLKLLERLSKKEDADVYQFSADILQSQVDRFRELVCGKSPKKKNAILLITTFGGDPDAAYRLCRCLRRNYAHTTFYVFGFCKSAGTLAAIGAHNVVIGNFGELGPLDVQLVKPDEVIPTSSGLDIFQAMAVLKNSLFETFEEYFLNLVGKSGGSISAKTSADIACGLAVGLYGPMSSQVDPERLGEVQRAINIANAYGTRLDVGNLKKGALDQLVQGYPTHTFVIDIDEAKNIFNKVRNADQLESQIGENLPFIRRPVKEAVILDLIEFYSQAVQVAKKGRKHAAKPKPKATGSQRAASAGASGGSTPNVAQLRRHASGNAAVAKKDHDSVHSGKGRAKIEGD